MSNLKMTSCPVCDSQNESNALLCNICGWDLAPYPLTFGGIPESYLEKEHAKIKWAKKQWQKSLETERINLANVKILEEHDQQHRLNKQQIQSQQEQLQLQTRLLEQQRSDSQQESKVLMDKLEELSCNLGKVQSTVDRIEADKSMLMTEVTRYQFDNSSTYEASDRPQNYKLAQEYKILKDQHLDPLASSILSNLGDYIIPRSSLSKFNYIRSILSQSILMIGQVITRGKVGELPKSEKLQDEEFLLATEKIISEFYRALSFQSIHRYTRRKEFIQNAKTRFVEQELRNTIKECLQFLQKVVLADPPELLSVEVEGEAFNSDRHEIAKGCPEFSGQVLKTIYPFYLKNGIVLTKAIVWLEPEKVDWLVC